ncbi:recombination regulator RecX [uncultured Limosilactobacillus sp.]|uniref:recombination regulator RecX n=1 Tax=uncultured Limosilactobacillus sp. TaxID=2837629 RepID=UPI0025E6CFB3|nr:recombination regulator RecX [uncultured Limosilactobacillus sp.]
MAKITKITAQKKAGRYNIYLNGKFAFPVSEEVLVKYRLLKGVELDDQQVAIIKKADHQSKVYSRALDYLSYQPRTVAELQKKLADLEAAPEQIEQVVERLKAERLLDDRQYAKAYVRTMVNTSLKGPRVISQKLAQKGVSPADIEGGLAEFSAEQQAANARKLAGKLYRRYHRSSTRRRQQKVEQSLAVQGYGFGLARQVAAEAAPSVSVDEQHQLLVAAAEKAWQKYRRFEGRDREQRVLRRLYAKGFDLDESRAWLRSKR